MTDNFIVLQHNYAVFVVFVAVLTVNWEFFAEIATASFDIFSPTSTASSLVVTVCAFLFVAVAGAIVATWILCHAPAFIKDPLHLFRIMWAFTRRLLETGV